MESASSGLMAGLNAARRFLNKDAFTLPVTTMIGALSDYISHSVSKDFQPMGANFGVIPGIEPHIRDKKERYLKLAERALADLEEAKLKLL